MLACRCHGCPRRRTTNNRSDPARGAGIRCSVSTVLSLKPRSCVTVAVRVRNNRLPPYFYRWWPISGGEILLVSPTDVHEIPQNCGAIRTRSKLDRRGARLSAPLGRQSRRDLRPRLTLHGSPAALAATSDELALPEGPAARLRTVDAAVEAAEQDLAERRARDDDRLAEWLQKSALGAIYA